MKTKAQVGFYRSSRAFPFEWWNFQPSNSCQWYSEEYQSRCVSELSRIDVLYAGLQTTYARVSIAAATGCASVRKLEDLEWAQTMCVRKMCILVVFLLPSVILTDPLDLLYNSSSVADFSYDFQSCAYCSTNNKLTFLLFLELSHMLPPVSLCALPSG